LAGLEAQHAPARVPEREEQTSREVVVAAPVDEPGREELLARESLLDRLARKGRAAERKPEPVLAADVLAESAPCEVVARQRSRLRVPQVTLVEACRGIEQRLQSLASPPLRVVFRRRLLVLELD